MAKTKPASGKNPAQSSRHVPARPAAKTKAETEVGDRGTPPMTGMIRARIDPALKAQAETILRRLGLNASDVIRLLYKQITLRKGLPFDVCIPNATTRRALRDAEQGKNLTRYESVEEMFRDLGL